MRSEPAYDPEDSLPNRLVEPTPAPSLEVDLVSHGAKIEPPPGPLDRVLLPDPSFDRTSGTNWTVVPCLIDKITLRGVILRNKNNLPGFLPWKKIQFLSVGRIRSADPSAPNRNKDFLVIDMILMHHEMAGAVLYRLESHALAFDKIFPRVEQTFSEAYQNFIGILMSNSGATPLPDRDSCAGPRFASFADVERYEARVKEKVLGSVS